MVMVQSWHYDDNVRALQQYNLGRHQPMQKLPLLVTAGRREPLPLTIMWRLIEKLITP
jgi:hypothetical protein